MTTQRQPKHTYRKLYTYCRVPYRTFVVEGLKNYIAIESYSICCWDPDPVHQRSKPTSISHFSVICFMPPLVSDRNPLKISAAIYPGRIISVLCPCFRLLIPFSNFKRASSINLPHHSSKTVERNYKQISILYHIRVVVGWHIWYPVQFWPLCRNVSTETLQFPSKSILVSRLATLKLLLGVNPECVVPCDWPASYPECILSSHPVLLDRLCIHVTLTTVNDNGYKGNVVEL